METRKKTVAKPLIPMFRFTLGNGQSIGPKALQSLWVQACHQPEATVGCVPGARVDDKATYSLYAPQGLDGLAEIEMRLRALLNERSLRVSLLCVHAGAR
ncbi:hypothetical protein [Lysobacter arvi]|uniref:Uncharacterized protein n=1 Tax=Lysobacter arvi TaxID=3038776 RepID=A0ABU1CA47_9GAMM|nr:hypothetical protein [Lysobacter arvi]MDR0181990.1 hypothetical protein [Lysobacter arvi]